MAALVVLRRRSGRGLMISCRKLSAQAQADAPLLCAGVAGAGEWQAEPPPGTVQTPKIPEGMSFRDFLICFYLLSKKAL